jgi:AraC-like DNA-binding protein
MNKIHQIAISPKFNFYLLFPEGLLADFVSMIWASDGTPPFRQERIIPDGASVLVFNFGDSVVSDAQKIQKDFQKTLFTGVFSHFSNMNYLPNHQHKQIGIIFKPAGSYPFIRKPIIEFKSLATETDVFDSKQFDEIHERLANEISIERRLFLLERILFDLLKKNFEENIIPQLLTTIRVNPKMTIEELVRKTGYSQQHLNRILGKYAGMNAKGFQKIFRIQAAMQAMQNSTIDLNLTDIAYQFNYFDQAHFIHDFKEMTGMTPKEYRTIQQPTSSRVIYL